MSEKLWAMPDALQKPGGQWTRPRNYLNQNGQGWIKFKVWRFLV